MGDNPGRPSASEDGCWVGRQGPVLWIHGARNAARAFGCRVTIVMATDTLCELPSKLLWNDGCIIYSTRAHRYCGLNESPVHMLV